jgi:N4-gp56 family major capsid protein
MEKNYINLQIFAEGENVQKTTTALLSDEMKTYYSDYLIDNAEPNLVHDQFAQKQSIPKNGGKTIEFRKYDPLPTLTKEMEEGVTPKGQSLKVSTVNSEVKQYGGYVELSDLLVLTAIDNNLLMSTKLLGAQAGRTLDTITREVLAGGTNVQYGEGKESSRSPLVGGLDSGNHYMTVECIKRAVRFLKRQNAEKIDGSYVAIIHPDVAYDLTSDEAWLDVKTYCEPKDMYEGEIGKLHGVRFIETTEAKVFAAPNLCAGYRNFTVNSYEALSATGTATQGNGSKYRVEVNETFGSDDWERLSGAYVQIKTTEGYCTVRICGISPENRYVYFSSAPIYAVAKGDTIYPGEAGCEGRDVYATLIFGANAYGTTDIKGGGLEHIVKQLGSGGTNDPLNQRATVGWKATKSAVRLVEGYMVRIETTSSFSSSDF